MFSFALWVFRMASTSETGLQLFARLVARPSLVGLEDALFPQGPEPKEVIELNGEPSCGKTLLLSQFIAKCILPLEWKGVSTGGLKAGVVLLNTDHHFQMYKLVSLMECRLGAVPDVEEVVKEALDRLIIYNIADSQELEVTLLAVQNVVSNRSDIGLILLDSVCAFYWQDALTCGIKRMNAYVRNVLTMMQKTLVDFKGVIMYTRPSYFQSKMSQLPACSAEGGLGRVNRRIILKRVVGNGRKFCATVDTPSGQFNREYTIDSTGFHWSQ